MNQPLTASKGQIRSTADRHSGCTCRAIAKILKGVGLFAAAIFLTVSVPAVAQLSSSGTINGTVKDSSGATVPGAAVSVQSQGTRLVSTSTSSGAGVFVVPGLQPGLYTVTVEKQGFDTVTITGVEVHPTLVADIIATLSVGKVATKVMVTANGAQIQTSTSEISGDLSARQLDLLPMNGRNFQSLSALMPGAVNTSPDTQLTQAGGNNVMSVNGMGIAATFYTLDGIWNENTGNFFTLSVTPPPETLQEVRLLQNNYSAQYNMMGANVIITQTKSGTSEFHGGAYEFLRNNAMNARNYFSPTVTPLKQNIYGYLIGGPFFIPHLYNQNRKKTFFFWSQTWEPRNNASVVRGASPTAQERAGDFSSTSTPIIDPTTGKPFPGNIIPANRLVPQALVLLNASAPLPNNLAGGFQNYLNLTPGKIRLRHDFFKVDHYFTEKYHLMYEYFGEHMTTIGADNGSSPYNTSQSKGIWPDYLTQLQFTAAISPTMLNVTSIAMNHRVIDNLETGLALLSQLPDYSQSVPFTGGVGSDRLPLITFSQGWSTFGAPTNLPMIGNSNLDLTVFDDWSWLRGSHYLKAGFAYYYGVKRQIVPAATNGQWSFSGVFTGNAMADYLLGYAANLQQSSTQVRPYVYYPLISPYVEDTWKATPTFTVTAGLRYLWMPVPHGPKDTVSYFDPSIFNPAHAPIVNANGTITPTSNYDPLNGLVFNGVNGVPLNFANVHSSFLAPTAGFAWDVHGDGKTSLRGGYGFAYLRVPQGYDCTYTCATNPPFTHSITLVNPMFPNAVGAKQSASGAPGLSTEIRDLRPGQIQTYSLSLQHQFPGNWAAMIAGAGNLVRHASASVDFNQPLPTGPYDFDPTINTGKVFKYVYAPHQGYAGINTDISSGVVSWNALELSLRHTAGRDLYLSAAYTWQHDLSNLASNYFFGGTSAIVQDAYHLSKNYGNSLLNVPQVFSLSAIWSIPWQREASGIKGLLLGGWQYSDITTIQSGFSLNPGLSVPTPGLATRPNLVGNISGPKKKSEWFNTAAFVQPPPGYFGNAAPGSIRGPGAIVFDMSLYKTFHIVKQHNLQFRAEAFNVFNHTNLGTPDTSIGSGTYGTITTAKDPRILELALRYDF